MSAAPAPLPQEIHIPGGWFPTPNVIGKNLNKLVGAELAYALLAYQNGRNGIPADITEEVWVQRGMTSQSRRNAERGLAEKKLFDTKTRRFDVRGFAGWARHADPKQTRTAGRAPSTPPKRHPACGTACALADGRAKITFSGESLDSKTSEDKTKPVLPDAEALRGADLPEPTSVPEAPPPQGEDVAGGSTQHDPEVKWAKTLAAMRAGFASAGVELLMRLLTLLWSLADFKGVSDYVLAAAVARSYRENHRRMESPALLLKLVPAVLSTWRAEGKRMDTAGPAGPEESPGIVQAAPYPKEPEDSAAPSVWMRIRLELKKRLPAQDYANWFTRAEFHSLQDGDLTVYVPDTVSVDWFETEFADDVRLIARELDAGVKRVIFKVPT
jgi:hypothetical protein